MNMRSRIPHRLIRTSISCLLLLSGTCVVAESTPPPSLAVFGTTGLPIDDHLRECGWQTEGMGWGRPLQLETLRRFQVIIIGTFPAVVEGAARNDWRTMSPEYNAHVLETLQAYVNGGGGLLVYAAQHPTSHVKHVNTLLKPWEARFLVEQVIDSAHAFTQRGGMGWTWSYTTAIAEHPVTRGVQTLFYPMRDIYVPANWPLELGSEWDVLVRGMPEARSYPAVEQEHFMRPDTNQPGTYAASPPLVAMRDAGKGRVLVCGWSPTHTFFNLDHFMVGNVFFSAGSGEVGSDGMRFLEQALAYLAEPAAAAGYGGYRNEPNRTPFTADGPIDWNAVRIGDDAEHWQRGLIGARTEWTGGSGSVEEYAAAAKAAGLDFIAFLEDFTRLDPERWDAFRDACRSATTPELLVLPGLVTPRGPAETEYFVVSDLPWPPADMLSDDGTRIMNYLYAHFKMGLNTHGPFRVGRQKTPPWISRAYNSQAVVTTEDGRSTVELEPYLYNVGIQDAPKPVAIDLITSPKQVADAARRFLNLRQCKDQETLRRTLKNPDQGRPAQISNGPVITTFQGRNMHPSTGGAFVPGRARFQMRIAARSDVPLRELVIYDGTDVYRRFLLAEPACDITVNGLHDQQRQFTAVVFDTDGRMAVRGPLEAVNQFNRRTICSDRQNSIGGARQADRRGNLVTISSSFLHPKFATHGSIGATPASASTVSWVPWYWDGTPGPMFKGELINQSIGIELPEAEHRWTRVHRMAFPMGSGEVMVQAVGTEGIVDKPVHSAAFTPVQDLPGYRAITRLYEFKKTPDAPVSMLIEGFYEMKQDGTWEPGNWQYDSRLSHAFYSLGGRPDEQARWIVQNPSAEIVLNEPFPEKKHTVSGYYELNPDGYIGFVAPQSSLAMFAVDRPLGAWLYLHRENWLRGWVGLTRLGETYRSGDRLPYRMVVFSGSVNTGPDTNEIEHFQRGFGLSDSGPAYTVDARRGAVRSTRYVLELDADDGGFAGRITQADLPHRLPVRVHGVNPNWTCAVVDREAREWRPLGTLENLPLGDAVPPGHAGYAALDLSRDRELFIGNVVHCDVSALRLTVLPDGTGNWSVDVHNPTDKAVTATIRTDPGFVFVPAFSREVTVPAGHTQVLELAEKAPDMPAD